MRSPDDIMCDDKPLGAERFRKSKSSGEQILPCKSSPIVVKKSHVKTHLKC